MNVRVIYCMYIDVILFFQFSVSEMTAFMAILCRYCSSKSLPEEHIVAQVHSEKSFYKEKVALSENELTSKKVIIISHTVLLAHPFRNIVFFSEE